MVQFNIDSRFNADARYKKVLFGYDGQLLEVELNELQDILNARLSDVLDNVFGTRPLYVGTYTVSGGVLTIANEIVAGNHELILLTSSTISVANGDTIYLNIQDVTKTTADSIKKYGDQNSQTTVTNSMLDSRVGSETTRRVQTTFMLTKTNTNPGTNIQLCSINSSGAVVLNSTANFADSSLYKEVRRLANEQITANNLEPLKNVYGVVSVGGTSLTATAKADTLTYAAGTAITLSGNATTRTLTISSPNATTSVDGSMSAADKTKLNGIATGAEVNQNAWSNVMAGATNLAAASKTDTLTVAGSNGISITGSGKTMTVSGVAASTSAVGTVQLTDSYTSTSTTTAATANAAKMAYDNAVSWAKSFGLGTMAVSTSGDLNTLTSASGFFYAGSGSTNKPATNNGYVLVQAINATYVSQLFIDAGTSIVYTRVLANGTWGAWKQLATTDVATQSTAGLLSAADKQKLDGMQAGATISQNAYSTVVAGGTSMAATTTSDTITLTPSGAITITGSGKTATFGVNTASTSQAGVTQLTDSYTSTSTTTAATANSAKMAYDSAVAWAKGFGLGDISVDKTGTDLNSLDATGFYRTDRANAGTLNAPPRVTGDHSYIYIVHTKHASGYYAQIAFDYNNVAMWKRTSTTGTWTAWKQLATTDTATSSANGLMTSTDKAKLDAINQALATTNSPTFAGMTLTGDLAVTSSSAHIKPAASGSFGFTNNAGTQWGLYVHDGAIPSAFTNKNTLDDGSGNATFIGSVTAPSFVSNVSTGTAPLTVTSTTKVANLNADMVDGYNFNQGVQTTDSPTFAALTVSGTLTVNGSSYFKNSYLTPQGTATSSTGYSSYTLNFQSSYWNGTAAATYTRNMFLSSIGNIVFTSTAGSTAAYIKDDGTYVSNGAFQSTLATGTAPLIISSTTKVANLNADQVDGYDFNQSLQTTDSPTFSKLTVNVATGTAPFVVTSTTKVANLNADMVDGYSFNQSLQTTDSPSFSKVTSTVATGTAPFTVTSTTAVANLNADMVDGYHMNQDVRTTASPTFAALTTTGAITAGTSVTITPSGTATSTTNYASDAFQLQSSTWNGTAAVTNTRKITLDTSNTIQFTNTSAANVASIDNSGNISGNTLKSTVASGTAPFTVTSTTAVTNLNADMVDGYHASSFALAARKVNVGTGITGGGDLTADRTLSFDTTWGDARYANVTGQTFTGNVTAPVLISNVATGTAPFTVTSTTKVTNLNADMVDGYSFNQSLQTTDSPSFSRLTSTVASGTAPFTVSSTTAVTNLNADMVDGYHFNQSLQTTNSPTFAALTTTGTITAGTSVTITPAGTATSTTSYGSDSFQLQNSTWSGTAAVTNTRKMNVDSSSNIQFTNTSGTNVASITNLGDVYGRTFYSTVATGTAPFTVTSTTKVANLNADMVDGYSFNQSLQTTDSPSFNRVTSTVATGTAPLSVTSTTVVTNLNADMLDGQHSSYFASTAVATTSANGLLSASDKSKLDGIASGADAIPAGVINQYAASTAPSGWLLCQGQAVSRTTYSALFGVISTTYGAGDGSTTFNLPNLQGRVPVGYNSADSNFNALGKTGGEATHTLSINEMPSHSHNIKFGGTYMSMSSGSTGYYNLTGWTTGGGAVQVVEDAAGGGAAHNNLQPYITLNYIIKY